MKKLITATVILVISAGLAVPQTAPPKSRVDNVTDEYFGQRVVDPYRWLEDMKSKETQDWMRAQANYTDNYLQKLPLRDELFKRLTDVSSASTAVNTIRQRGNLFFYQRRAPDEQDFKVYVREGLTGTERLIVDPNKVKNDGKRYSLSAWNISFDGKYVSYQIAAGGAEDGELRIIETATCKDIGDAIDRVRNSAGEWLPDGKSFLYRRLQKLEPNAAQTEKYQRRRVYRHVLGTSTDADKPVFGNDVNPSITVEPELGSFIYTNSTLKFVVAGVNSGVTPNSAYYVTPIESLDQTPVPWRKIASLEDEVATVGFRGDDLYLLTHKNAPRHKVIRTSLATPDLKNAETIFSGGDAIVTSMVVQADALYVNTLDGGNYRIHRVDYKTRKSTPLEIPYEGSAWIDAIPSDNNGIYYSIVSWTRSIAHFRYDPKTKHSMPTNLVPPNPIDMSNIEFVNLKVKSHDSVLVPMVIMYKRGLKRDGENPTLMDGYGAYGIENVSPYFDTSALPWVERGGILVWTGIRGGGEYGEAWHRAGFQRTKPNTWKDFIACAEYLIAEKYTSPRHLAIRGASAGGILISNSIATRPDLFEAAIIVVGVNNTLRFELTANGSLNIPEFGSAKTEEGFRSLFEMDGYHKVKDGVKYPAVLLTHGINDPRVDAWMSAKMAARLQAATASAKPVLLRLDYDAGHGQGSTKEQRNRELADTYAFLFDRLKR